MSFSVLAAAAEAPDRLALVVDGAAFNYADLALLVRRAMNTLDDTPRVALVARPALAELVLLYALLERRTAAVLLHPRLTASERDRALERAAPVRFVDETAVRAAAATPPPEALASPSPQRGDEAPLANRPDRIDRIHRTDPCHDSDDERDLAILFTSGTSGEAKGVRLSRRAFGSAVQASSAVLGWRSDDRWLLGLPFAHVGGLSILLRCLAARRAVVVSAPTGGFAPPSMLATIARERITLLSLVPTQLAALLSADTAPAPATLRAVLLGGAPASPALVDEALARGWPVLPTYGLTEACSQVATIRPGERRHGSADCGRPLPGVEVRVVDGAIEVRGANLLSGYLTPADPVEMDEDRAASTAPAASSTAAALSDDGWFRTGDAGRLDGDGRLHVLGRRDRMIISGGENVAPIEVELALERAAGVASACVFGVADPRWGELVSAALVSDGKTCDEDALRRHLELELAAYKRPRLIAWVPGFATLPSGKPDLAAIRAAATPLLRPLRPR